MYNLFIKFLTTGIVYASLFNIKIELNNFLLLHEENSIINNICSLFKQVNSIFYLST